MQIRGWHCGACRTVLAEKPGIHGIKSLPERYISEVNGYLQYVIYIAAGGFQYLGDVFQRLFRLLFNRTGYFLSGFRLNRQLTTHVDRIVMDDGLRVVPPPVRVLFR
ncbi:hypothetical protein ES703_113047 [subsurface metagenome]